MLGFIVEDDITKLLDEIQLIDFYHFDKTSFKVLASKVDKYLHSND